MDKHKMRQSRLHGSHLYRVSPYKVFRQKLRKVRYPFIGLGVVVLFFASVSATGDMFKADVLSGAERNVATEATYTITPENLELVKKGMLILLNDEQKECEKLDLKECGEAAKNFISMVVNIKTTVEAEEIYNALQSALGAWDEAQAKLKCEINNHKAVKDLQSIIRSLKKTNKEKAEDLEEELKELKNSSNC